MNILHNGKINGHFISLHENGQKSIECNYCNGKLYGRYIKWHNNGNKEIECNYVDDELYGSAKWYHSGVKYDSGLICAKEKINIQCQSLI